MKYQNVIFLCFNEHINILLPSVLFPHAPVAIFFFGYVWESLFKQQHLPIWGNSYDIITFITLHVQCKWSKRIGVGIHMFVVKKKFFNDRPTFSNISHRIYRLALPLRIPERFAYRGNQGFTYNVHLALFVRRMTQLRSHKFIGKYCLLAN